jgi:RimJ/RimL family protein N-acetyltransferase
VTGDRQTDVVSEAPTGTFRVLGQSATWAGAPPVLRGAGVTVREAVAEDAAALLAMLGGESLAEVMDVVPGTIAELARRLESARAGRCLGREVCLAIVPADSRCPVGLFRVREAEPGFGSAEWQFAVASEYWGRGLFFHAAPLVVDFVFDVVGAHRLEARAAILNGRGTGALRKLGAVREAVLRQAALRDDGYTDQALWTIIADDWHARTGNRSPVH